MLPLRAFGLMIQNPKEFARGVGKIVKLKQCRCQIGMRKISQVFFKIRCQQGFQHVNGFLKHPLFDHRRSHADLMICVLRLQFGSGLVLLQRLVR